jgi:hypothetical protein
MSNNVITIRHETARQFLPTQFHNDPRLDLTALAEMAKNAIEKSDASLSAAKEIADSSWWNRFFNSGEMQSHVIHTMEHIRDISKVNLGLSAICNDLAAANLEHASRIDKNHHTTNQQLNQVQQLTAELLANLRKPREPALLDRLLPALSKANPADQDAMRGWLRTLTEEIDLQYAVLQENLDKLSQQNDSTVESVTRFRVEIASLSETLTNQKADAVQQLGLLSSRLSASVSDLTQRADKTDATIRKSHEVLAAALTTLNQLLARHQTEFQNAIQSEHASRDAMQQAIVSLIKQREGAVRTTIGELNQHLLKRMLWGAGGIVVLQVLGLGFLAFKMGLFK